MGKFVSKGKPASRDINVTPLIDVVLVLLIIFMVITPVFIYEMAVNMPKKRDGPPPPASEMVFKPAKTAVCEDGTYSFNGEAMALEDLFVAVDANLADRQRIAEENPPLELDNVVFVDGHPDAPYPNMVALMDTIMRVPQNDVKIAIAKLKEEGEFDACGTGP